MRWVFIVLVLAGCPRVATLENGTPGTSKCPAFGAALQRLEQVGSVTLPSSGDACQSTEVCVDRDVVCRCDVARGGAPRPNWWTCHRAKAKKDGCPDDEALLGGASCAQEGKTCRAPRECSCDFFTQAVCQAGRWTLSECRGPCLAP